MPFFIGLFLKWGLPGPLSKIAGWAVPIIIGGLALWGAVSAVEHSWEKKGAAKVTAKVEKAHAAAVVTAHADEHAAQVTTDHIGVSVAKADEKSTELLVSTIEDLHHALAVQAAAAGSAPGPVDTPVLSASLDRLVAGANGAAEAADAQP